VPTIRAALAAIVQTARDERGDSLVNWLVLAIGLAAAAAIVVALLRPAIQSAGEKVVNLLGG
jgi:hypothetical protein